MAEGFVGTGTVAQTSATLDGVKFMRDEAGEWDIMRNQIVNRVMNLQFSGPARKAFDVVLADWVAGMVAEMNRLTEFADMTESIVNDGLESEEGRKTEVAQITIDAPPTA
ncbi:hypothetical protein ABT160_10210 [Streptomyces sp. NPDC001941]|uniref:hypothetical protein n=1 Tax=Streptomyces sp. NPDC001941 TaxID=3154659 RepID=UPI00331CF98E